MEPMDSPNGISGDLPSARDEGYKVRSFATPRAVSRVPFEVAKPNCTLHDEGYAEIHMRRPASVEVHDGRPASGMVHCQMGVDEYHSNESIDLKESNMSVSNEVVLNVYNMSEVSGGVFSGFLNSLGMGMFHVGVQVYDEEWTFNPRGPIGCNYGSGVVMQEPGIHPTYSYHESVILGSTKLSEEETKAVIQRLKNEWSIESYHELRRNSVTFAEELCKALGVRPPPSYVSALSKGLRALMFT